MESAIAANPHTFPVIPGTGGFRKARWRRGNRGKSGGVRGIFYYYVSRTTIYLFDVYAKNEKENLTREEINVLRRAAAELEHLKQA